MALDSGAINVGPAGYRLVAWGSIKNSDATVSGGNGISAGSHGGTGINSVGIAAGLIGNYDSTIVIARPHGASGYCTAGAAAQATSGSVNHYVGGAPSDAGYVHVEIWARSS